MASYEFDAIAIDAFARSCLPEMPDFTSRDFGLKNIFLMYYQHSAWQLNEHFSPVHILEILDADAQAQHSRRLGDETLNRPFRGGETFFCPANVDYGIRWEDRIGFTLLSFHPALFEEELECRESDIYPLFGVQDFDIQYLAQKILQDIQQGCPNGSLYSDTCALLLGFEIVKRLKVGRVNKQPIFDGLSPTVLREVRDFIQAKVQQGESLNMLDLATIAGVSQTHFIRLFKASTGRSPHIYYDELRMQRAVTLLKNTDYSVARIAYLCGFTDQSYFSRKFRQWFHVSPSQFRHKI